MDIKLNNEDVIDFDIVNNDIESTDGMLTAVFISLKTDARVTDNERGIAQVQGNRGWWGDNFLGGGEILGSKIWLFNRAKVTQPLVEVGIGYIQESLKWLVDDGALKSTETSGEIISPELVGFSTLLIQPNCDIVNVAFDLGIPDANITNFRRVT